jgi:hypothetical protein
MFFCVCDSIPGRPVCRPVCRSVCRHVFLRLRPFLLFCIGMSVSVTKWVDFLFVFVKSCVMRCKGCVGCVWGCVWG